MKNIFIILVFSLLTSCNTLSEAGKVLRNEKVNTTDEFLVKKKQPLELPPDYNKLPTPKSQKTKNQRNDNENLKKILNAPEQGKNNEDQSISVEKSILERIRK
tara:strand:+ start:371 stop:679 length:309 start_codon:yes stop_codon:yes gene_type:complete